MRKAALHNLGCKVNSYETEAMQQILEAAGYVIVPFEEAADVYVVNTCSVTNVADKKSRQMLHKAKKRNPDAVVVAAGCYVQAVGEELLKDAAVDIIIGNNKKTELAAVLDDYFAHRNKANEEAVIDIGETREYENMSIHKVSGHTRAFLKVQDGCNQFCSYCIIPYTRGRVRSRDMEDIKREAKELAASGYRELVLTGIHLSSYGVDFPEGNETRLLDLIRMLHGVPGVERIRLGSLEPRIVTEEFAGELKKLPKVCPHFHLSLQSGCDATLKRMNRRYTAAEYLHSCEILRQAFDRPAITTDVIVGFPGETEEEFGQTRHFLEKVHFYEMHVFKYSKREGTRAAVMPDQVPEETKNIRSAELLELEKRMSREYREGFFGEEKEVLMEEACELQGVRYMVGHTAEYVKAAVPYEENLRGEMIRGKITHMLNEDTAFLERF